MRKSQEGRGHWTINYTLRVFINLNWLFQTSNVQTFQLIIFIYIWGNFECHHWGCIVHQFNYRPLSYIFFIPFTLRIGFRPASAAAGLAGAGELSGKIRAAAAVYSDNLCPICHFKVNFFLLSQLFFCLIVYFISPWEWYTCHPLHLIHDFKPAQRKYYIFPYNFRDSQ